MKNNGQKLYKLYNGRNRQLIMYLDYFEFYEASTIDYGEGSKPHTLTWWLKRLRQASVQYYSKMQNWRLINVNDRKDKIPVALFISK